MRVGIYHQQGALFHHIVVPQGAVSVSLLLPQRLSQGTHQVTDLTIATNASINVCHVFVIFAMYVALYLLYACVCHSLQIYRMQIYIHYSIKYPDWEVVQKL